MNFPLSENFPTGVNCGQDAVPDQGSAGPVAFQERGAPSKKHLNTC